jgi:hypothetical protein
MRTIASRIGSVTGRALLALCRCDGLKDAAVVALLVAVLGAFVVRLVPAPAGTVRHGAERFAAAPSARVLPV